MPAKLLAKTIIPSQFGTFNMLAYESEFKEFPHIALYNPKKTEGGPIDVRMHSECMTGDLFGSVRCECGEQLEYALERFGKDGGILIYLRQEGRGIGLVNKMKAYNLQDEGLDTVEANLALGHQNDTRNFNVAVEILNDLKISEINLLTNNPEKLEVFENSSVKLVKRIPIEIGARDENRGYLLTKKRTLGHLLNLER